MEVENSSTTVGAVTALSPRAAMASRKRFVLAASSR